MQVLGSVLEGVDGVCVRAEREGNHDALSGAVEELLDPHENVDEAVDAEVDFLVAVPEGAFDPVEEGDFVEQVELDVQIRIHLQLQLPEGLQLPDCAVGAITVRNLIDLLHVLAPDLPAVVLPLGLELERERHAELLQPFDLGHLLDVHGAMHLLHLLLLLFVLPVFFELEGGAHPV